MSGYEQRPGDYRVICDYSGFMGWASDCVRTWNGLYVLRRFAGEEAARHPQESVRARPDQQAVPRPRPDQPDVFLAYNQVQPSDL